MAMGQNHKSSHYTCEQNLVGYETEGLIELMSFGVVGYVALIRPRAVKHFTVTFCRRPEH